MGEQSQSQVRTSIRLGMLVTAVGGFLDAYSFSSHGGVFAGAQSGNIVQLAIHIARWDGSETARLLAPILGFIAGSLLVATLRHDRLRPVVRDALLLALGIEIVVLAMVGFLPSGVADSVGSAVVAFAAGIQLSTFRQLHQWTFSTTMTTVNIVNTVTAAVNVLLRPDAAERSRMVAFSTVVGGFLIGALLGSVATRLFDARAIWLAMLMLIVALAWLIVDTSEELTAATPST